MRSNAFPFYLPDRQSAPPNGIAVPEGVVTRFLNRLRRLPADRTLSDCWPLDGHYGHGGSYVHFTFDTSEGDKVAIKAHRLSYLYFNGPIPDERPFILHRCNVKGCANPTHVYAGTPADNRADIAAWEAAEAAAGRETASARHWKRMREAAAQRRALRCDAMAA